MIRVSIFGKNNILYDNEVKTVKVKTEQGNNIFAKNYVPIISLLNKRQQIIEVIELNGESKILKVKGGILKFNNNHLNIITNEEK